MNSKEKKETKSTKAKNRSSKERTKSTKTKSIGERKKDEKGSGIKAGGELGIDMGGRTWGKLKEC